MTTFPTIVPHQILVCFNFLFVSFSACRFTTKLGFNDSGKYPINDVFDRVRSPLASDREYENEIVTLLKTDDI